MILTNLGSEILQLIYYRHNRNARAPAIAEGRIPFCDMTVVLGGRLEYEINGRAVSAGAGDAVFIGQGSCRSRAASLSPADYVSFNFTLSGDPGFPVLLENAVSNKVQVLLAAADELNRDVLPYDDENTRRLLACVLSVIKSERETGRLHPLAGKIDRYIRAHYAEKIDLKTLGAALHYSPVYCDTVYKRETGQSIVGFVIDLRMEEAKKLLIEGAAELTAVSEAVGFSDYNYFSRAFKKRTGYTPSEYRKLIRPT